MYPTRRPYGGSQSSRREHDFARTFMSGQSHSQSTRGQRSFQGSRPLQSSRLNESSATQMSGTTTVVRPGEPHNFGTRTDRPTARLINRLCRCRNPDGHGDAWAFEGGAICEDIRGLEITWKQLANRVLDHYAGKTSVSWDEEHEAYRHLLHPINYQQAMNHYRVLNRGIGMGLPVVISPHGQDVRAYTGDGHVRNNVTEDGLRTMVQRGGSGGRP